MMSDPAQPPPESNFTFSPPEQPPARSAPLRILTHLLSWGVIVIMVALLTFMNTTGDGEEDSAPQTGLS